MDKIPGKRVAEARLEMLLSAAYALRIHHVNLVNPVQALQPLFPGFSAPFTVHVLRRRFGIWR